MTLLPPKYVPIAAIRAQRRNYPWDDWDPYSVIGGVNPETADRLSRVSNSAMLTFVIGCAEWVIYRFEELEKDSDPYDYLEASWVFEMTGATILPPHPGHAQWVGPVRMSVAVALGNIRNTVMSAADGNPKAMAAFAEKVAIHVLDDPTPFRAWEAKVLDRMEALLPRRTGDPWQPRAPREILDPDEQLTLEMFPRLITEFLKNVDYESNRFIQRLSP